MLLSTFWRLLPWQQRVKNIGKRPFYTFPFFLQFLEFPLVKMFLTLTHPFNSLFSKNTMQPKMLKNASFNEFFEKIELERYNLCLELHKLLKKFTEGNARYLCSFLCILCHTFFPIINKFPAKLVTSSRAVTKLSHINTLLASKIFVIWKW